MATPSEPQTTALLGQSGGNENGAEKDPGAFTVPWSAVQRWRRVENAPLMPVACNENNGDFFNHGLVPLPEAAKPDF